MLFRSPFVRFFSRILNRITITVVLVALQLLWLCWVAFAITTGTGRVWVNGLLNALSLLIVLYLVRKDENSAYKVGWIALIGILPLLGGALYLAFGNKRPAKRLRLKMQAVEDAHKKDLVQEPGVLEGLDAREQGQSRYVAKYGPYPAWQNTRTQYFACGEAMYPQLLADLEKAEKSIFLEFFIVSHGCMWNGIEKILRRKAAAGLDVRVIYDDAGCLSLLPHNYAELLRAEGIRAFSFNRCVPVLNLVMNNRDHRKIMVIDGRIGFTGGVNLADEYINRLVRFGYWKDSGVRLEGPGAGALANIFLTFWKAQYPDEDIDIDRDLPAAAPVPTDCLVQPFADTPVDREAVAKNVYLELINQAQRRLQICTPYLILDNDLLACLRLAAKRGVDVRIYTPGVPDKPTIYQLTRSYFPHLLRAGVRIFSYTPGFLHAKTWLVDDRIAAVGTVNLDYRSLYLHFENSVLIYGGAVLDDVRRDLAEIEKESAEVKLADCRTGFFGTMYSAVLRLVAPLC